MISLLMVSYFTFLLVGNIALFTESLSFQVHSFLLASLGKIKIHVIVLRKVTAVMGFCDFLCLQNFLIPA